MISQEGVEKKIGDTVWVAGFENKDTFYKPIKKQLQPNFKIFFHNWEKCLEYCKPFNEKK